MKPLHVAVVGHVAGEHVAEFLGLTANELPVGYTGAPLTGILIGELLRLGHRVTAITTDSRLPLNGGPVISERGNFCFVVCPSRQRAWRPNGWMPGRAVDAFRFERKQVSRQIALAQPDIVHVHWSYEFALAALDQPIPHLITCHDSPAAVLRFNRNAYRAVRYLMARRVFQRGRCFTTVSDYMAETLTPCIGHRPVVIPNPIAESSMRCGLDRPSPNGLRVALIANGWASHKNTTTALRGFAIWRESQPDAELWLYGVDHGPGEVAQRWATDHGLTRGVNFVGRLPHEVLMTRLGEADVLLHTALEESFGVVLVEALALGLPVVGGLHSGAVPWVLAGDSLGKSPCAVLIDVTSAQAVAEGLAEAFRQDSYSTRSSAARVRARAFAPGNIANSYVECYRQALDMKHSDQTTVSIVAAGEATK
jgi:glycosyltransferase involved in cell wall biosynthesis